MPTKKNIQSPDKLYELFIEYKTYCKNNPKKENFFNHREQKQGSIDREVPLTWKGFEVFLFKHNVISRLEHYKANTDNAYSEYLDIIKAIDDEIYEDKFGGATAGIYQHNIIARDLGLSDKQDVTVKAEQPLFNLDE